MSDLGRGKGRGRRGDGYQSGSPSSASSTPSSASGKKRKGKGRGRGQPGADYPPGVPGGLQSSDEGATASVGRSFEEMSLQESGDVSARQPSTIPKRSAVPADKTELKELMKRPNYGSAGKQIALVANHFPLKIPPGMKVQHYDFAISRQFKRKKGSGATKRKPPPRRRVDDEDDEDEDEEQVIGEENGFEIVLRHRRKWPKWLALAVYRKLVCDPTFGLVNYSTRMAFDGRQNVFAQCALPVPAGDQYTMDVQIPDEDRIDTFVVTLRRVAELTINLREVFNRSLVERKSTSTLVLDVILRQSKMFSNVFISMGSRAFYHPQNPISLSGGIWHYPGIWGSARPVANWKSTINLDLANTAFVKSGPLLELLKEIIQPGWERRQLNPRDVKAIEKLVKGLKVNLTHRYQKRTVRCVGVTRQSASELTFPCEKQGGGTGQLSVQNYFRMMRQKGEFVKDLQYPHLPCLHVGNKSKANYVPLEFCEVKAGQRYNHKLSQQQTSEMLRAASQPAPERKRKIEQEAQHFELFQDPYMKSFGLTVDPKMVDLTGRVLSAPTIEYDRKQSIPPKDGGWNMRDVRVIKGATIREWAVINTDQRTHANTIATFCISLIAEAERLGMTFVNKQPKNEFYSEEGSAENIEKLIKGFKEKAVVKGVSTLDLVFVVLSEKNSIYYSSTKSAGDVVLGVNTQCILGRNLKGRDGRPSTPLLVNLLLKINAKMGGVNNKLLDGSKQHIKHLKEPILIIGADVNHPAPTDGESAPSVAAVVANMDQYPAQYAAKIMVQLRRQESIAELQQAVQEMIFNFRSRTGFLPTRIIMYRDGVGESMFLKVLTDELHSIRQACEVMGNHFKLPTPYRPPITFIVVQKRHHTRLFCAHERDQVGRGYNIPPGTTVDTVITHPEEFDFFLCSHLGLQGTSRPTHYHVLWDDSEFTADELQLLTYYLCYTYIRAMKSVSIPPPVYYADLVAYRARQYLQWNMQRTSETASTISSASAASMSEMQSYVAVKGNVSEKGMYFV